ncbi:hypothetical protein E4T56_gene12930 [Termitomyces sp. T112]|nr:hypothetical protein E4T56_gene12930 [Termitomyces sp. T112]
MKTSPSFLYFLYYFCLAEVGGNLESGEKEYREGTKAVGRRAGGGGGICDERQIIQDGLNGCAGRKRSNYEDIHCLVSNAAWVVARAKMRAKAVNEERLGSGDDDTRTNRPLTHSPSLVREGAVGPRIVAGGGRMDWE